MHPTSVYFHYISLFHFPSSYFGWMSQCPVDTGAVIYIDILLFCGLKWCTGCGSIVFLVLFCFRCRAQQYHLCNMCIVCVNLLPQSLLHRHHCLELIITFMVIHCSMFHVSIIVGHLAGMVQRLGGTCH